MTVFPGKPVTVVIPCYNEEQTIGFLKANLARLEERADGKYSFRYIFVDDASTDATIAEIERHFAGRSEVKVLRNPQNLGVAGTILNGLRNADTDLVCSIDCDCTVDPEYLIQMLPLMADGIDVAIASPLHPQGRMDGVPAWRLSLSMGAAALYRAVLHQKLASYTICVRIYRREAIRDIVIRHRDFVGVTEILAKLDFAGARMIEIPAVLGTRRHGQSKMRVMKTIAGHLQLLSRCALARLRLASI